MAETKNQTQRFPLGRLDNLRFSIASNSES
jgi:hypothetical protein